MNLSVCAVVLLGCLVATSSGLPKISCKGLPTELHHDASTTVAPFGKWLILISTSDYDRCLKMDYKVPDAAHTDQALATFYSKDDKIAAEGKVEVSTGMKSWNLTFKNPTTGEFTGLSRYLRKLILNEKEQYWCLYDCSTGAAEFTDESVVTWAGCFSLKEEPARTLLNKDLEAFPQFVYKKPVVEPPKDGEEPKPVEPPKKGEDEGYLHNVYDSKCTETK